MKVIAKYVTVEAMKDRQVLTLLFPDWNSKRDFTDVYKERGVSNG